MDSIRVSEALGSSSILDGTTFSGQNGVNFAPFLYLAGLSIRQHLFQLILEILAAKALSDDLALGVDEDVEGDAFEIEGLDGFALPIFEIADLGPVQLVGMDGLLPRISFFVERDAEDRKIFVFEFVVNMNDIGV